ncbi:hypothetical protein GQ600_9588 [Phytophthora cactorum]|nr:hypothetical protein GQ600_9588 [Phytophthora cactorum]
MNEPSLRGRAPTVELRRTTVTLKCSHPFVIPEDLVKSLTAALQTKNLEVQLNTGSKVCASSSTVLDVDASPEATKDLVVKFKSAGPMFSSSRVDAMMNFYQLKKNTVNWKSDVSWLKDDWSASCGVNIESFAAEVGARGMSGEQKRQLHCRLAHDFVEQYNTACLQSHYSMPSTRITTYFWEIVGYLAGNKWMNDSTVNYAIQAITGPRTDVRVLSSHVLRSGFPKRKQTQKLSEVTSVILPVNHKNIHWTLIIVTVNYTRARMIGVHFYDPLAGRPYKMGLECIWRDKFWSFIHRWHKETLWRHDHRYSVFIQGHGQFELQEVTKDVVKVMRLRILWVILCGSIAHSAGDDGKAQAAITNLKLTATFLKTEKD